MPTIYRVWQTHNGNITKYLGTMDQTEVANLRKVYSKFGKTRDLYTEVVR